VVHSAAMRNLWIVFMYILPLNLLSLTPVSWGDGLFLRQLRLRPSFNWVIKSSGEGQIQADSVADVAKM